MPRYRQCERSHCGNSSARKTIKEARQHCKVLVTVTVVKLLEAEGEVHGAVIAD